MRIVALVQAQHPARLCCERAARADADLRLGTAERTQNCDYAVIMWSVDSNDWKYKNEGSANVDTIVNNVMSQVQDGSIILMHDIYENTYLASKEILKQLNDQGYEVVTVSELLGSPKAGVKYSKAS